jgi:CelD/BcsL family acetyltransferase involved in cellulose biosynthesis
VHPDRDASGGSSVLSTPRASERLQVRVVRDVGELEALVPEWKRLQPGYITADPAYFEVSLRVDPSIVRPHVVVLERDGQLEAMLIARLEERELSVRAGYKTIYSPRVTAIVTVYDGILGNPDDRALRLLVRSVRDSLADGEADMAIFHYLPVESPEHRLIEAEAGPLTRQYLGKPGVHWELELPDSFAALLGSRSRNTRKYANKIIRRLEEEFGDRLEVKVFADPADLDVFFRDVDAVVAKTYQHALGIDHGDTPARRERVRVCMEEGWFLGTVLYVDGRPVSFLYGELYGERFRGFSTGYDPALADFNIGTYVRLKAFELFIADGRARLYDHGVGDDDFKRAFGTRSWIEKSVVIYAGRLRPVTINLVYTTLEGGVRGAKRLLGRGALFRRLKRSWRAKLKG